VVGAGFPVGVVAAGVPAFGVAAAGVPASKVAAAAVAVGGGAMSFEVSDICLSSTNFLSSIISL